MYFLVQSEFTINWATLASLIVGMGLGVVLFILIYALVTIKQVKNSTYTVTEKIKDVDYADVEKDIIEAKKSFLIKKEEDKAITFENIRVVIWNLIKKTASRFYPDSKEPLGELTLEEIIMLDRYIISKIEKVFDKRFIKPFKKVSLTKLLQIINAKNTIENNKVVKGVKKSGIKAIVSSVYSVVKVLNPAAFFNKIIINPLVNQLIKHICLTVIEVIGQETYHIYSKQAFLEPVNDQELENILKQLDNETDEKVLSIDNNTIPVSDIKNKDSLK